MARHLQSGGFNLVAFVKSCMFYTPNKCKAVKSLLFILFYRILSPDVEQWGFYVCNASQSYPIAFSINPYCIAASVLASATDSNYYSISIDNDSNRSFILNGWRDNVKQGDIYAAIIAIEIMDSGDV